MTDRTIRPARADDRDDVVAFTSETWSDRDVRDYIPDVFSQWIETDGPTRRTVVADVEDSAVAICQGVLLTDEEAWLQGMRVAPDHRGADHGRALTTHLMDWAATQGATVARNMVFDWNPAGMGQSRALGFSPTTSCRWAEPAPGGSGPPAEGPFEISENVARAWRYWTHSDVRTALGGLALDPDEAWALSELDRTRLAALADRERVFTVRADRTRGMAVRVGTRDRDGKTVADYAVGAWDDPDAARALFEELRSDAADCGADDTRVCIPDSPRFVSDAALARAALGDDAVFIFSADLSSRH
jgi:GNAT superfamily N-acetyltransferase